MVNSILVLLGFYLPVGFGLSLASGDAETSPGGEILWGIVLFVAVPFQLAGIIWFILERHQDRVQARLFGLTVLLQLALLLYTLVSCIHYFLGTVSCQIRLWHMYCGAVVGGLIYTVRAFALWYKFEWAQERVTLFSSRLSADDDVQRRSEVMIRNQTMPHIDPNASPFFHRHRKWVSSKRLWMITATLLGIVSLVAVAETVIVEGDSSPQVSCDFKIWESFYYAFVVLCALLLCVLAFKLRNTFDAFGLKTELRVIGAASVVLAVSLVVASVVDIENQESMDILNKFPSVCLCLISVSMACWYPLLTMYRERRKDSLPESTLKESNSSGLISVDDGNLVRMTTDMTHKLMVGSGHDFAKLGKDKNGKCGTISSKFKDTKMSSENKELIFMLSDPNMQRFFRFLEYPPALEAFRNHLVREFSVENLLFWETVIEYHHLASRAMEPYELYNTLADVDESDKGKLEEIATVFAAEMLEVFNEFIVDGSPFQINISASRYLKIKEAVENFDVRKCERAEICNVFIGAMVDVTKLLYLDSFRRFVHTDEFRHYTGIIREIQLRETAMDDMQIHLK